MTTDVNFYIGLVFKQFNILNYMLHMGFFLKLFRSTLALLTILTFSKSQVITQLQSDTRVGYYPTITHLTGTTYVGAWSGQSLDGYIATLKMALIK